MAKYSFKKAALYSGLGVVAGGLISAWRAANHLDFGSFETFTQAFMHVAPPEAIVAGAAISAVLGFSIELINSYNRGLDKEENHIQNQNKLTPSQK